ncbi:MAG: cbb3-type cytochrome c oxidase subunit I, partial [Pseudomonadota bacterium]
MTDITSDTDMGSAPKAQGTAYDLSPKGEPSKDFEAIWATPPGWRVITSVSHRVVGKRFLITGFIFFLIAGLFALLVRLQLLVPENTFLDSETYNQLFTMHGTIMMFLFAIPMLEGFAVYLIPLMIGARDLVFPRLGAFGYWCYLFGGIIVLSSFLFDAAPMGGWFMYVPLSTSVYTEGMSADFWLIGITLAEIASVTAAVEIIAAILCSRAPGMTLTKMPILMWYLLATAFMIAVAFPPLIIGSILLEAERLLGLPFFDIARGGDPLLWQHLFWLFGHPEVYIIFLPAAGMVATMLPVFVGKPLFGYGFVVAAIVTMAFLSFGLWAHHMFATGLPEMSLTLFSAASTMVAVPTGVQIFCFIATLSLGRPRLTVPMMFILGFLCIFVLGGHTGVM